MCKNWRWPVQGGNPKVRFRCLTCRIVILRIPHHWLVGWGVRKSVHLLREKMGGSLMGWPTHSPSLACATIRSLDQVMAAQPGEVHRGAQTVVKARGSRLMDLHGVGPVVAARTLADLGDVARFPDRNSFASWTGPAPLDASSGEQIRHRLSRAGNRRMNHMIHIAAIGQIRLDTAARLLPTRARRRQDPARNSALPEATDFRRHLRELMAGAHRTIPANSTDTVETGSGGHCGASQESSAVDLPPHIDTSDQPLPGPAEPTLQPQRQTRRAAINQAPSGDPLTTEGSRKDAGRRTRSSR